MPDTIIPRLRRTFRPPEIWIVLQALGAVLPGTEVPPEVAANPAAVTLARAALISQGSVIATPAGSLLPAPEVEALVRPAVYPDTVLMADIRTTSTSGRAPQLACFGWTPQALVVNWVDSSGDHQFESYSPQKPADTVWGRLLQFCDLDIKSRESDKADNSRAAFEKAMAQMSQIVMLMVIAGLRTPSQTTRALGWFVSNRQAWLMKHDEANNQLDPIIAGPDEIRTAVSVLLGKALPRA